MTTPGSGVWETGGGDGGDLGGAVFDESPVTVTHTTDDGNLKFTQSFFFSGYNKGLYLKMKLENLGRTTLSSVVLRRAALLRVDRFGALGWSDGRSWSARTTKDAVFAWQDPSDAPFEGLQAHGLMLRHLDSSGGGITREAKITDWSADCSPASLATPESHASANGPPAVTLEYRFGSLNAGASKSVEMQYLRF